MAVSLNQVVSTAGVFLIVLLAITSVKCDKSASTNFCQGCRSTLSFISRLNETRNHQKDFKKVLSTFCSDSYPPATDYRHGPCDYYVAKIFQLMDRMNPDTHCDEIGACGQSSLIEERSSILVTGMEQKNDNIVCNICVDTVNQFKESLTDPNNVKQVRNGFKRLCEYLDKIHEKQHCEDLFNNYIDQILQFAQQINPKTYCAALDLCNKYATQSSLLSRLSLPSLEELTGFGPQESVKIFTSFDDLVSPQRETESTKVQSKGPICTLCKSIIKQVSDLIKNNRTEAAIDEALEKVCGILYPSAEGGKECDQMVDKYSHEIIQILIDETAPELVCMMMNLCLYDVDRPAIRKSSPHVKHQRKFDDIFLAIDNLMNTTSDICLECKLFVHFIKNKLTDVKSIEELKHLLNTKVCDHFPDKNIAETCKHWVEQFAETFFDAIVHNLNTEEVCEELQACSPKEELASHDSITGIDSTLNQDNYCDTCTSTVSYIDKLLATQSVDKEISHLVDTVCNKFPHNGREECRLIVDTFGPEILRAIATMNNPHQLCCDLGLCHKDPNQKMILGASKCSFGPGYWCLSKEHATACRAHDYCRRKVWKAIN